MKNTKLYADGKGWRTLSERAAYHSPYLVVTEELVATPRRPGGQDWTVAHRPGAAVVAPRTRRGGFVMVRQERIPVRRELWEFPAGQVDASRAPTPAQVRAAARRELREEAGLRLAAGGRLVPLGMLFSSPGFTSEHAWLFLADPVEPDPRGHAHDEAESIAGTREFTPGELREMVAAGVIADANSLAVYARLAALRLVR